MEEEGEEEDGVGLSCAPGKAHCAKVAAADEMSDMVRRGADVCVAGVKEGAPSRSHEAMGGVGPSHDHPNGRQSHHDNHHGNGDYRQKSYHDGEGPQEAALKILGGVGGRRIHHGEEREGGMDQSESEGEGESEGESEGEGEGEGGATFLRGQRGRQQDCGNHEPLRHHGDCVCGSNH